jgi:hypothetical protein
MTRKLRERGAFWHAFLRKGDDAAEALRKPTLIELRSGRGVPLSVQFQAIRGAGALIP